MESKEKHDEVLKTIKDAKKKAEACIETLMSATGSTKISNTE